MAQDYMTDKEIAGEVSSNVLGLVKSAVLTSSADFVSTLYNSTVGLLPVEKLQTEDILRKADADSLSFYNEHKEGVQAASFMAGIVAPQLATVKLLNLAKRGETALGMTNSLAQTFTGKKADILQTEIKALFEAAKYDTPVYNNTMYKLYATKVAENTIDAAIFEATTIGTLNAHPYMEDYMQSPFSNFAMWSAIGGVAGGILGVIGARTAVREATGSIAQDQLNVLRQGRTVFEDTEFGFKERFVPGAPDVPLGATRAMEYQTNHIREQNFKELAATSTNAYGQALASESALLAEAAKTQALYDVAPFLRKLDTNTKKYVIDPDMLELGKMIQQSLLQPEFLGVNRVSIPNLKAIGKGKAVILELDDVKDVTNATANRIFFRPSTGEIFSKDSINTVGLAADIKGFKPTDLKPNYLSQPETDFKLNNLTRAVSSAYTDARFLDELATWKNIKPEGLNYIAIGKDDLPRMNAAMAWGATQKDVTSLQFRLTNERSSYAAAQAFIETSAGVKPNYTSAVMDIVANGAVDYKSIGVSSQTSQAITNWIHGGNVGISEGIRRLRAGMDSYLHGTLLSQADQALHLRDIAEELWKKGEAFRNELRKHANADGNIFLYRKSKRELKTGSPIESYSIKPNITSISGKSYLKEIPVDNVIGTYGTGQIHGGEYEILVAAPHYRDTQGKIPIMTGDNKTVRLPIEEVKTHVDYQELVQTYREQLYDQVHAMKEDGAFSFSEIAARLNIKPQEAEAISALSSFEEMGQISSRYNNIANINRYIAPENKMVSLQGNPYAVTMTTAKANLDKRMTTVTDRTVVDLVTAKANNQLANEVRNIYSPSDVSAASEMRAQLDNLAGTTGDFANQVVKSVNFQSLDNALRHVDEKLNGISKGMLVPYIGKRFQDAVDRMVKQVIEPVAIGMKGLGTRVTALPEFNAVENKLNSLKGWRDIRVEEESGYGYIVQKELRGKDIVEVPVLNKDGSTFYIKQPEVLSAFESTRDASVKLLGLHNLVRDIRGQKHVEDLGFYLPPPDLRNKFLSYIVDSSGKTPVSILHGNSAQELAGLEAAWRAEIGSKNPLLDLVNKSRQEEYNLIHGYTDFERHISIANNQLQHGGSSSSAVVVSDTRRVNEIIAGFEQQVIAGMRKYNSIYLDDVNQGLDLISKLNQRQYLNQPGANKAKGPDAAKTVKNALNAINNINESVVWKNIDDFADLMLRKVSGAIDATVRVFKKDTGSAAHFDELSKELDKAGIKNPWESYDLYSQSLQSAPKVESKRIISAGNATLSLFQLRLADMAHPLVNILSTPILTNGAVMEMLPKTTLPNGEKFVFPMKLMYDGTMHQFHPEGIRLSKLWEKDGEFSHVVREYSDLVGALKSPQMSKGAVGETLDKLEAFQNSKMVEILTKPADFVEQMTRKSSMHIGYLAAKTAYPEISDKAATIFASAFTDRAVGNYYAAQKPTLFQGTAGAAIGLYQTYMLTFAQHVYRTIEKGQFQALSQSALLQSGIFGTSSMPGYNLLSEFIGKHMSNENYDLTTGTYRALPDPIAQIVLYGTPSWIGPSLYTRGDVTPRIPTFDNLAMVNTSVGVYNSLSKMFNSLVSQPGVAGKLQGMLEALSLQTLSRPIARMSEIVAGESITQKGQTVSNSDDVWTFNGISSRLLSVRPLEEQNIRNALHLNSFYGQADRAEREKATGKLRTAIRAGNMTDDLIETVAQDYLRHGGSAKGWSSVMNEIMARTEEGTSYDLMRKLEPNSPLRRMIKDTF